MLDPFLAEVDEDVERLREIQREIHEQFKEFIRSRRGSKLTVDEEILFSGEFWTGQRSEELGLIDGLGDFYSILKDKFGENANLRIVGGPRRLGLQRLLGGRANVLDHAISNFEERLTWGRFGI